MKPIERRVTSGDVEIRRQGNEVTIEGHAVVWDQLSQDLGGFVESAARGATTKTIKEADIRALLNHHENYVLGRNRANTLDLAEDSTGLHYRIRPPDTSYARDLMVTLERGDITQSSFAFICLDDEWDLTERDYPHRTLKEIRLIDVSPVTYPAYLGTDAGVSARSMALTRLATRAGVQVADLVDTEAIKRAIAPVSPTEDGAPGQTPTHNPRWAERAEMLAMVETVVSTG